MNEILRSHRKDQSKKKGEIKTLYQTFSQQMCNFCDQDENKRGTDKKRKCIGLGSLRNKMPQAFIAISPLLTAPIGFIIGGIYFTTAKVEWSILGSFVLKYAYFTPFGVFRFTVIWAVIGLIAGIATVALNIKQKEKETNKDIKL